MHVRINFAVDVDDDDRKVIANYYGDKGRASREVVQRFFQTHGINGHMTIGDHRASMPEEDR